MLDPWPPALTIKEYRHFKDNQGRPCLNNKNMSQSFQGRTFYALISLGSFLKDIQFPQFSSFINIYQISVDYLKKNNFPNENAIPMLSSH